MSTDEELLELLTEALTPPAPPIDPARIAMIRDAASSRATAPRISSNGSRPGAHLSSVTPRAERRWPKPAAMAVAAAAVVVAVAVGASLAPDKASDDQLAGAVVEFETTLQASAGDVSAEVVGLRTGIGRIVQLRTDELPILPQGDLYEVWFVGPGDRPGDRNRISAGTFHPDPDGRSDVDLTAAVDPAKFPLIEVTAEPGDGSPEPTGPVVLSALVEVG